MYNDYDNRNNLLIRQKVIFLGDQGVGKTSILNRFLSDKFENDLKAI